MADIATRLEHALELLAEACPVEMAPHGWSARVRAFLEAEGVLVQEDAVV